MTDELTNKKNIQLKDMEGSLCYPATKASIVINDAGDFLGGVEADAQVNVIEKVTVNNEELEITDKTVSIEIPEAAEYSLVQLETAEDGYSTSYQLTKNGEAAGDTINIPKDLVVQSGSLETVTEDDTPVEGYKTGDKYLDLVLANSDNTHIYILVSDLADTYTAGEGIIIEDNTISLDTSVIETKADKADTLAGYGITDGLTYVEFEAVVGSLSNTVDEINGEEV